MRIILFAILLLLPACSALQSPADRYYATVTFVKATGELAQIYVDTCKQQTTDAPCRRKFAAINSGAMLMKNVSSQADKIWVSKDSKYYDLSLTAAQNAALALRNILEE